MNGDTWDCDARARFDRWIGLVSSNLDGRHDQASGPLPNLETNLTEEHALIIVPIEDLTGVVFSAILSENRYAQGNEQLRAFLLGSPCSGSGQIHTAQ